MKRGLIVGRANVGKTLFFLHFIEYLGAKNVRLHFVDPQGNTYSRRIILADAVQQFVGERMHQTRCLQFSRMALAYRKGKQWIELVDSTGIESGIHENPTVRKGMAQTLEALDEANVILHLIDCSGIQGNGEPEQRLGELDYQLARCCSQSGTYAILANKMDLAGAESGFQVLASMFPDNLVIPISAQQKTGFEEVEAFVRRHL